MFNFHALRPDINAQKLRGPGSGQLRDVARAWHSLADELALFVDEWVSKIRTADLYFRGPAAGRISVAANQYGHWLTEHAAAATRTGDQLDEAAAAYDTAVATMVPAPTVVANRLKVQTLKLGNLLGTFAAAIAQEEAVHQEMWTHNADVMTTYKREVFRIMEQERPIIPAPMVSPHAAPSRLGDFDPSELPEPPSGLPFAAHRRDAGERF
ncbi:PPE family protein [Mycobacterium haemophilum DSM 44634]|uniref:PPE family protein n=1 Tax=Mycobacterium haemophilum TaxID=29311 RepID=UPI0006D40FD5|nr:PPE family protein [Mycobacterium haemophilum]ALL56258.1 hypothetical protein B586_14650 [Mycobacterium haemophilum DSM 44634]MCV7341670.1 PPE family protein [Mycobacterium haemophilum DSM 44634]